MLSLLSRAGAGAGRVTDNPVMQGVGLACGLVLAIAAWCNGVTAAAYFLQVRVAEGVIAGVAGRAGIALLKAARVQVRIASRVQKTDVATTGRRASGVGSSARRDAIVNSNYVNQVSIHLTSTVLTHSVDFFSALAAASTTGRGRGIL